MRRVQPIMALSPLFKPKYALQCASGMHEIVIGSQNPCDGGCRMTVCRSETGVSRPRLDLKLLMSRIGVGEGKLCEFDVLSNRRCECCEWTLEAF